MVSGEVIVAVPSAPGWCGVFDFVLGSAILPSAAMRARRPRQLVPAIDAVAEALPFDDHAVDAAMAMLTVHQWSDPVAGLAELRAAEARRFPPIAALAAALGPGTEVHPVPVPQDCADGFVEAYYGRPEAILDPAVRAAQSGWGFLEPGVEDRVVRWLAANLQSGAWDDRWGSLRTQPEFPGTVRLVVGRAGEPAG